MTTKRQTTRRKSPSANQNWTQTETLSLIKKEAQKEVDKHNEKEKGHKIVYVPHPTLKKTFIQKII